MLPEMVLRVVSLPPTISSTTLPRYSSTEMSLVCGLCASMEIRSLAGGALTRCSHSSPKTLKHSNTAWAFCVQLSTGPWPGWFMIMSDQ
ncbi:MAG: hypothetical protein WDM85_06750 [Caulobacteraceae bacterium]